jgi:hypothetical protein
MNQKVASERILHNSERYYIKEANPTEKAALHEMFRQFIVKCWTPSPSPNLTLVMMDKETNNIIGGMERNIDAENRKALGRGFVILPQFQREDTATALISAMDGELKNMGIGYVKHMPFDEWLWRILKKNGYDWTPVVKYLLARTGQDENKFHEEFMEKHL